MTADQERDGRRSWALLGAGAAVVLTAGGVAYGVAPAASTSSTTSAVTEAAGTLDIDVRGAAGARWSVRSTTARPAYTFSPGTARSTCALGSPDPSGTRAVGQGPANAVDGRPETAWHCASRTARLVLDLRDRSRLTDVGLLPGAVGTAPANASRLRPRVASVTHAVWTFLLRGHVVGTCAEDIAPTGTAMAWAHLPALMTADRIVLDVAGAGGGAPAGQLPDSGGVAVSDVRLADDTDF
ncbi:hypothetical protein [Streptomyces mangrovisoli]|uniref:Uncharacterized protein n=1 Tax=Streptomyces mangrovisoli TaxID=1428628 RepID=A0A1J4NRD7_9ACTN|nr:hypothetical protein [Streptomyces mangrovisoli]OIJ64880.1 hypothetical protein WN71_026665 [Streptomyces mangrovisoli]